MHSSVQLKLVHLCRSGSIKNIFQNARLISQFNCPKENKYLSSATASSVPGVGGISPDFFVSGPKLNAVTGVTIPEFIWSDLAVKENAIALECAENGRKVTHGDVYRQSRSFATALKSAGVQQKDVICVLLHNSLEYSTVLLGILEAGGICCPINPSYTNDELITLLRLASSKMVITSPEYLPAIRRAQKTCPNLKSIILIGSAQDGCHTYSEMIKVNSKGMDFLRGSQIDTKEQVAILPFSSGTTGLPKGVELTHSNICSSYTQYTSPDVAVWKKYTGGDVQERLIGVIPFYHAAGLGSALVNHLLGTNVLCVSKFTPDTFVKAIKNYKPTMLALVPTLVSFVANSPDLTPKDFDAVRCVRSGTAVTGIGLINRLFEKLGREVFFQEAYGLTETSPYITVTKPSLGNNKLGSCGSLVPGTLAKIVNVDSGERLGPSGKGELCIKGPQVMKGYFGNEKASKSTIDSEGWFHTGDIAYYDTEGCFYIVDRLKELIKVKGLQVAPAELEDEIRKHPDVIDAAVIGIPNEKTGELPRAYIVRKTDSLTESDVNEFLHGKISKYKELKGGIEFLSVLPKSPVGKILRKDLKKDYLLKITNQK